MDAKIFDTLLEPVFIVDGEQKVIYANEPAALISDHPLRRILRQNPGFLDLFQFEVPIDAIKDLKNLREPSPYQEVIFHSQSGQRGKTQITIQPFSENQWIIFYRDVTLEERLQRKYRAELEQKESYILELQKAQTELEKYSKGLEKMVAERTAELSHLNTLMKALLDSLGQGFFIFDSEGKVLEISSKACESVIQKNPQGLHIWEALNQPATSVEGIKKWMLTIFSQMLPFEDLAPLGPTHFPHSGGRKVDLKYFPLLNSQDQMDGVVVVATDTTDLVEAQRQAEIERSTAKMIVSLVQNQRQAQSFVREAKALFQALQACLQNQTPNSNEVFRILHTLKGGAASFSIQNVVEPCHAAESLLGSSSFQSLESNQDVGSDMPQIADPKTVDWNKISELCKTAELNFSSFLAQNEVILGKPDRWSQRWVELPISSLMQFDQLWLQRIPPPALMRKEFLSQFLLEPIEDFFSHFDAIIQMVASTEAKTILPLKLIHGSIRIWPEPYSRLFSCLVHAYRNAVDHGIETADVRAQREKPMEGMIVTRFTEISLNALPGLEIRILDDGGGIDPEKIREKLKSRGINPIGKNDQQVIQHVFDAQFSTRDSVSEISGRGVGMDAILTEAKALGGIAWVESVLGEGTSLIVQVPLFRDPADSADASNPSAPVLPTAKVG